MAVIGKIQKNSILLLIVIGGAMLAFIFTDLLSNLGGGSKITPTATIYGEEIDDLKLNELEEAFVNRDKQNFYYQQKEWTPQAEKSAKDQAFNEFVRKNLMNRELNSLGIVVPSSELNDMILGNNIHPWVAQIPLFQDFLGQYSRDSTAKYINFLESEPDGMDTTAYQNWLQSRKQWKEFEDELIDAKKADKYVTLVKKGLYVNSIEAKHQYIASQENRKISFVVKRFSDILPDEVTLTDEELLAYFEEHKNDFQYKQKDESVTLDFVEFQVLPSEEDIDALKKEMEELKVSFKKTDNDIYFMASKSTQQFYSDSNAFQMGMEEFVMNPMNKLYQYPTSADDAIQAADSGDVIGPFISGNNMVIAKVKGFEKQNQAWVRHILISTGVKRTEDEAKKVADSVIKVINQNNNFVEMVEKMSDDPGSIATKGEYKWFPKGRMVPEFEDASFNGAKGKLQLVKTTYGYHIVEVIDRQERKLPILAPVVKNLKPSEATKNYVSDIAYDFITQVKDTKSDSAFYEAAMKNELFVRNTRTSLTYDYIMGFSEDIGIKHAKQFAFAKDAVTGDVSNPIYDGGYYKVAYIVNITKEGVPKFEDVKEQMRYPALQEKQAKKYIEIMSGTKNLQEVVNKVPGSSIQSAVVNFNVNTIQGAGGHEPKVIGSIFAVPHEKAGAMLVPIQGVTGVYVIIVEEIIPAPETTDYSIQKESLKAGRQTNADNLVIRALREKADVKDNRARIDIQGR